MATAIALGALALLIASFVLSWVLPCSTRSIPQSTSRFC